MNEKEGSLRENWEEMKTQLRDAGYEEVMEAYEEYETPVLQAEAYLNAVGPRTEVDTSNSSS